MSALIAHALGLVPLITLVSLRVALVLSLLPAPFGELAPVRIRAVLSFTIAFALCLPLFAVTPPIPLDPTFLLVAAVSELVVGAVMGLTARVSLAAAETAGTLAGNAMGLGFAGSVDPLFGGESLPTTTVLGSLGVLIFFAIRGHHTVFEALAASLSVVPCGAALKHFAAPELLSIGTKVVAQGLRIASPVVATMFIVQLGTALVARAAPRVQIFALSFGVSASAGALMLLMSAPHLTQAISSVLSQLPLLIARSLVGGAP
jgi:flagellar biosynthetic protein FliR